MTEDNSTKKEDSVKEISIADLYRATEFKKTKDGQLIPWRGYPLSSVLEVLARIQNQDWVWYKNTRCKYINLSIDTRDGGFVTISDRDNNLLSLRDLLYQYGEKSK